MASHWYSRPLLAVMDVATISGVSIDFSSLAMKVGLSGSPHAPLPADTFLSFSATDFTDGETTAIGAGTGYTVGFGNSGRKSFTGQTIALANGSGTNDRIKFSGVASLTWTALNPANTVSHATLLHEPGGGSDSTAFPIINLDFSPVDPNGNDFVLTFHTDGVGYIQC